MRPLALLLALLIGGCTQPSFDVVDQDGMQMFEIRRGSCWVGCKVLLSRFDGERCSGYAPGLEEGVAAVVQVSCPEQPLRGLYVEALSAEEPNTGRLGEDPFRQKTREEIDQFLENLSKD